VSQHKVISSYSNKFAWLYGVVFNHLESEIKRLLCMDNYSTADLPLYMGGNGIQIISKIKEGTRICYTSHLHLTHVRGSTFYSCKTTVIPTLQFLSVFLNWFRLLQLVGIQMYCLYSIKPQELNHCFSCVLRRGFGKCHHGIPVIRHNNKDTCFTCVINKRPVGIVLSILNNWSQIIKVASWNLE